MKFSKRSIRSAGFSFIELLIALAVFSILVGAIFGFFTSQRDTYLAEELKLERDQNLRIAIETIVRELSTAGYRAAGDAFLENLATWAPAEYLPTEPVLVTLDANPKITLGEGDLPDVMTFACTVPTETNPTALSEESDGTAITVSLSNSDSEKQYKPGDILAIGYLSEHARVVAVDGNTLTVDTDPEASGFQPLQETYPAGTPLEEISIVSYAVFNDQNDPEYKRHEAGRPVLKRKINAAGFYPVAENISLLKVISPADGVLQVSLTGLPARGRFEVSGSGEKVAGARVSLRNGLKAGFASDCTKPAIPAGLVVEDGLNESFPCRILISWEPVKEDALGNSLEAAGCPVTGYRVYFDGVSGAFGNHIDVSTEDASGYMVDVSAVASSEFYISVATENSGGLGERSPEAPIFDTTSPGKAGGLTAAVVGANSIGVSWDENSECDLAGYYLYRKKDSGSFTLVTGLIPAGSGAYTDAGLEDGATYTYRVEAVDFGFNTGEMSDAVTVPLP